MTGTTNFKILLELLGIFFISSPDSIAAVSQEHSVAFSHEPPNVVDFSNSTGTRIQCSATGDPPPVISWLVADGNQVTNVSGLRYVNADGTLAFPPFRAEDYRQDVHAVLYKCVASNPAGTIISRDVNVRAVVLQPYDVYVYDVYIIRNNSAVFRCHVPSFFAEYVRVVSWIRDSAFVIQSSFTEDGKYSVMPTGELYIKDVGPSDAMTNFRCQIQHRLTGEVKMSASSGKLFMTEPQGNIQPRLTDSKASIKANQHDTVVLPCIAQGHPVPTPKWFTKVANGHLLPVYVGDRIYQPNGALVIKDAQVADSGVYVCVISNNAGSERIETTLAVTAPLTVDVQPPFLLGELSKAATFRCHVSSFPITSLYWLKDGRPLPMPGIQLPTTETVLVEAVRLTDRGMYQCVAKRGLESAQGTAELKIGDIAPAFRNVFEEKVLQPGPGLMLQCVTFGSPKPTVSWTLDGISLPEGSDKAALREHVDENGNVVSRLTISKIRAEDGGIYSCISENVAGIKEHFARINIYGRPGVRPRPKMTVVAGDNVKLICPVYGYPVDSIKWEKDGVILPVNLRQTVLLNGTLVIEKIQRATDSGKYVCIVENKQGQSARGETEVIVMVPPKITPFSFQEELLREGMRARLQCVVSEGDLPLSISWLKDHQPIPVELGVNVRELDEVSSILAISSVAPRHNGNYTCVATNDAASASHTAALFVNVAPKIIPFSFQDEHLFEGVLARISCVVYQGDLPLTILWMKDGYPIASDHGISIREIDDYSSILTIEKVETKHNGNFTCVVSNDAATVNYTAQLTVYVPPRWVIEPKDSSVVRGEMGMLHCRADGFPPPVISWMKAEGTSPNAERRTLESNYDVEILYNGTLLIRQTEKINDGYYFCRAANGVGEGLSKMVRLIVHVPAHFETRFYNYTVLYKEDSRLSCEASGDLPITITWRLLGEPIDQRADSRYKITEIQKEDGVLSELMISQSERKDSGIYSCLGANTYGSDEIKLELYVQEPPDPPIITKVETGTNRSIHIFWSESYKGNSQLLKFIIQYKEKTEMWDVATNLTIDGSKTKAIIRGLHPGTTYHVRLFSENEIGLSKPSVSSSLDIEDEPPGNPPRDVEVEPSDPQSLRVTWKAPLPDPWTKNIRGYYIGYKAYNSSDAYKYESLEVPDDYADDLVFRVSDLRMYTQYSIVVQAYNEKGRGPYSPEILIMTSEDVPNAAPSEVTCSVLSSQSIHVSWQPLPVKAVNGILRGYKVLYKPSDEWYETTLSVKTAQGTKTTLQNLEKSVNYSIQVLAFTKVGDGPRSETMFCKTHEDVPGPPEDVKALPISLDSIMIAWKSPLQPNGNILHYNIYVRNVAESHNKFGFETHYNRDIFPHSEEYQDATKFTSIGESSYFEVKNLKSNHQYEFWVTASTSIGEGQSSRVITQSPIGPLVAAKIASFSDAINTPWKLEIKLPCVAVGMPHPDRKWIFRGKVISETRRMRVMSDGTLLIKEIDKADAGNYTCLVSNKIGDDQISYSIFVQVPPPTPSLVVISSTFTSIELQWKPESDEAVPVNGYVLHYKREFGQWEIVELKADILSYRIDNLWCGTKYLIYIQSYNKIGVGTPSEILTIMTDGSAPKQPLYEQLLKKGSTFVTIMLEGWPSSTCPIMYFVVEYKEVYSSKWNLVSNNAKLEQKKVVVPGLQPGSWYIIRVTAHNSAGSTLALFNVSTLTLEGGTIGPEIGVEEPEQKGVLFYLDLRVIIPMAISLLVLFFALILMCIFIRRRSHDDHLIKGRIINGFLKSSSKLSSTSSTGKNYSVDSFPNVPQSNEPVAKRYPVLADRPTKGSSTEEIIPYATTQLPNFHYGEMKTFGERKSVGGGSLGGPETEETHRKCKTSPSDQALKVKSESSAVHHQALEADGKAAWTTASTRLLDPTIGHAIGGSSPRANNPVTTDTKWRIVQRNLGNISRAKVHGIGSENTTQETTFIFPKSPDEGCLLSSHKTESIPESDRYDEPIPPLSGRKMNRKC